MAAHPRFADACWMVVGQMLGLYGRPGVANGFARDLGRLFQLCLCAEDQTGVIEAALADDLRELYVTVFMALAMGCQYALQATRASAGQADKGSP